MIVAPVWQLRWGTIPDTSWLIHTCERLLTGDRLYIDIVETNPPFSIWLYLPVVWMAQRLGVEPETAVHLYTYLIVLAGLGFAIFVASRAKFEENAALLRYLPLILAMFVIFAGNAFSEREHIATALMLPFIALTAWRATDVAARPGLSLTIAIGAAASVLVLVKPYYALVILFPALYAAWKVRRPLMIFSAEYWTIGFLCLAYLAAVMLVHPEFLRELLPVLTATYMKMTAFLQVGLKYGTSFLILGFFAWRLRPVGRPFPTLAAVVLLAGIAATIPVFVQAKGWAYHSYTAFVLILLGTICLLVQKDVSKPSKRRWAPTKLVLIAASLSAAANFWGSQRPDSALVERINALVAHPTVASITSDMAAGHPMSRTLSGTWTFRYNADWLGAYGLYQQVVAKMDGRLDDADKLAALVRGYVDEKTSYLVRTRPDVIFIDHGEKLWVDYFTRHPPIAKLFADYTVIDEQTTRSVYLRMDLLDATARLSHRPGLSKPDWLRKKDQSRPTF